MSHKAIFTDMISRLRIFFFGLNASDRIKIREVERLAEDKIRKKYAEMEAIRNSPVPQCHES